MPKTNLVAKLQHELELVTVSEEESPLPLAKSPVNTQHVYELLTQAQSAAERHRNLLKKNCKELSFITSKSITSEVKRSDKAIKSLLGLQDRLKTISEAHASNLDTRSLNLVDQLCMQLEDLSEAADQWSESIERIHDDLKQGSKPYYHWKNSLKWHSCSKKEFLELLTTDPAAATIYHSETISINDGLRSTQKQKATQSDPP